MYKQKDKNIKKQILGCKQTIVQEITDSLSLVV